MDVPLRQSIFPKTVNVLKPSIFSMNVKNCDAPLCFERIVASRRHTVSLGFDQIKSLRAPPVVRPGIGG
jgi:hypothetical protein